MKDAVLLTLIAANLKQRRLVTVDDKGIVSLTELGASRLLPEIPYHQNEGTWLGLERSTEPTISSKVYPGVGITEEMLIDAGKKGSKR